MIAPLLALWLAAATPTAAAAAADPPLGSAYPTETTADYVIGCMAANGQSPEGLRRCACSIDAIASVLPYTLYERAETILRMRQATGEAAGLFRESPSLKAVVDRLRAAQVEADFRCF